MCRRQKKVSEQCYNVGRPLFKSALCKAAVWTTVWKQSCHLTFAREVVLPSDSGVHCWFASAHLSQLHLMSSFPGVIVLWDVLGSFHLPLQDDSGIMCSVAFAGLMSLQPRRNDKDLRARWISRLCKKSYCFSPASRAEFERRPVLICNDRWQRCFVRYIFHVQHLSKCSG